MHTIHPHREVGPRACGCPPWSAGFLDLTPIYDFARAKSSTAISTAITTKKIFQALFG